MPRFNQLSSWLRKYRSATQTSCNATTRSNQHFIAPSSASITCRTRALEYLSCTLLRLALSTHETPHDGQEWHSFHFSGRASSIEGNPFGERSGFHAASCVIDAIRHLTLFLVFAFFSDFHFWNATTYHLFFFSFNVPASQSQLSAIYGPQLPENLRHPLLSVPAL
jgi:hypothetical protein